MGVAKRGDPRGLRRCGLGPRRDRPRREFEREFSGLDGVGDPIAPKRRRDARDGEARSKPPRAQTAPVPRTPSLVPPAPRFALARRVLAIAALAAGLLVAGAPGGPTWPRGQSIDAGLAAYRAFAAASDVSVEFRTSDPETLTKWLTPQFAERDRRPQSFLRTR